MSKPCKQNTTHFGYQVVDVDEKQKKVSEVFHSVATKYDAMNDLMSFGIHRLWKRITIFLSDVRLGHKVLDLAGGSGDLASLLLSRVGKSGQVVLSDINDAMLQVGRDRLIDAGGSEQLTYVQANAETLPFKKNYFDCITIGFGLRNVTDKNKALRSMYEVLKPGGKLMVLEFSHPTVPGLASIYDWYSFKILPKIGKLVANDSASYQYLAESIRMHPDQEALRNDILEAGFEDCEYRNFAGGIVALHTAYKY